MIMQQSKMWVLALLFFTALTSDDVYSCTGPACWSGQGYVSVIQIDNDTEWWVLLKDDNGVEVPGSLSTCTGNQGTGSQRTGWFKLGDASTESAKMKFNLLKMAHTMKREVQIYTTSCVSNYPKIEKVKMDDS